MGSPGLAPGALSVSRVLGGSVASASERRVSSRKRAFRPLDGRSFLGRGHRARTSPPGSLRAQCPEETVALSGARGRSRVAGGQTQAGSDDCLPWSSSSV